MDVVALPPRRARPATVLARLSPGLAPWRLRRVCYDDRRSIRRWVYLLRRTHAEAGSGLLLHPSRPYLAPTGARRPPMWRAAASRNHQIARTYGPWPCPARRRPVKVRITASPNGPMRSAFSALEGPRAGDFWVRVNPARRFPYRYSVSFASFRRRSDPRHLVPVDSDMAACDPHPPAVPQSLWKVSHTTHRRAASLLRRAPERTGGCVYFTSTGRKCQAYDEGRSTRRFDGWS